MQLIQADVKVEELLFPGALQRRQRPQWVADVLAEKRHGLIGDRHTVCFSVVWIDSVHVMHDRCLQNTQTQKSPRSSHGLIWIKVNVRFMYTVVQLPSQRPCRLVQRQRIAQAALQGRGHGL